MRTLILMCLIAAGAYRAALAQGELSVNGVWQNTQRDPQVGRDAAGNIVGVWTSQDHAAPQSKGDIVMRWFTLQGTPLTGDLIVNTVVAGDQERPAIAVGPGGECIVVWASFVDKDSMYDIKARRFSREVPLGDEFLVNTFRLHTQTEPDVAIADNGDFIVVWESWDQDGSDRGVFGRRFTAAGAAEGPEVQLNTTTLYSQARPAAAARPGGGCVVVWESWHQELPSPSGYGVFGRTFDAGWSGSSEFQVNSTAADYQWQADVETFADSSFVVAWCSWEQDGSDGAVVMQRFGADGTKIGGEVPVNSTTAEYQWLPRIAGRPDGGWYVVWSSWKQDGDREGVYAQSFTADGRKESFETGINASTLYFQWEPAALAMPDGKLLAAWSSWIDTANDYDIIARMVLPVSSQGFLGGSASTHVSGRSTTSLIVEVVDSSAMNGHTYRVTFDTTSGASTMSATITDSITGVVCVDRYPLDRGEGYFYLTPVFDGVAVQFVPEFDLALDSARSYSVLPSGSNLRFSVVTPTAGSRLLAPIDVVLVWGSADTLADGRYASPLDTALTTSGGREILTPFRAWNLTDGGKVDLLVREPALTKNKRWDPGEEIDVLTPPPYRKQANNTHAGVLSTPLPGSIVMPGPGDSTFVLTEKPILPADVYRFTTLRSSVVEVSGDEGLANAFRLDQNYPNPFNPATTIEYTIGGTRSQMPGVSEVRLVVYDIIGREVAVLVNEKKAPGTYEVTFDATRLASGVYLYRLTAGGYAATKKMVIVK